MRLDVYIAVEDLDRSVAFYAGLLGTEPVLRNATYVAFEVGGSRLGLMASTGYAVPVRRGNSAVPTRKVDDPDAWYARIKPMAARTSEIVEKGVLRLFMFFDFGRQRD